MFGLKQLDKIKYSGYIHDTMRGWFEIKLGRP